MKPDTLTSTGRDVATQTREWGPWVMIPGKNGTPYKVERTRAGEEPGTQERFTAWVSGDPRLDPHTHPWPFEATIKTGGYTERRYYNVNGEWMLKHVIEYRPGDVMSVPSDEAHVIFNVLPGTTTHMRMGKLVAGPKDWGHLVYTVEGFEYVKNEVDPEFMGRFKILNTPPA